jgi:hypothetical protein
MNPSLHCNRARAQHFIAAGYSPITSWQQVMGHRFIATDYLHCNRLRSRHFIKTGHGLTAPLQQVMGPSLHCNRLWAHHFVKTGHEFTAALQQVMGRSLHRNRLRAYHPLTALPCTSSSTVLCTNSSAEVTNSTTLQHVGIASVGLARSFPPVTCMLGTALPMQLSGDRALFLPYTLSLSRNKSVGDAPLALSGGSRRSRSLSFWR